jgi:hypothetical protein
VRSTVERIKAQSRAALQEAEMIAGQAPGLTRVMRAEMLS